VALNTLTLHASGMPFNKFGYFLVAPTQALVMNPGGSQGNLCLGSPFGRFAADVRNTGLAGAFAVPIDLSNLPLFGPVAAGESWNFQCWYRDNNPGSTSNFTDAVEIFFP